jgi:hypothetical protein
MVANIPRVSKRAFGSMMGRLKYSPFSAADNYTPQATGLRWFKKFKKPKAKQIGRNEV